LLINEQVVAALMFTFFLTGSIGEFLAPTPPNLENKDTSFNKVFRRFIFKN